MPDANFWLSLGALLSAVGAFITSVLNNRKGSVLEAKTDGVHDLVNGHKRAMLQEIADLKWQLAKAVSTRDALAERTERAGMTMPPAQ